MPRTEAGGERPFGKAQESSSMMWDEIASLG